MTEYLPPGSEAETTLPTTHPDHPVVRYERRRRVDRDLKILKKQIAFLFALIVFAMVVLSIYQQVNMNRIEYARYDLCIQRQQEIIAYNAQNLGKVPPIPLAECGPDPRTD
jgi:hypothetical protein